MPILEGILAIGLLLISLVMLPGIALAALGPVNRAAGAINAPTRFQISDLLWLSALLQAVLAFCIQTIDLQLRQAFVPICGFLSLTVITIWAAGVSFLSRAGVVSIWKRACLLLLSLPGTLALMIGTPTAILFSVLGAKHYFDQVARGELAFDSYLAARVTMMGIVCAVSIAGLAVGLRYLSFWIVGDQKPAVGDTGQSAETA